jgi:hypothetical protein
MWRQRHERAGAADFDENDSLCTVPPESMHRSGIAEAVGYILVQLDSVQ